MMVILRKLRKIYVDFQVRFMRLARGEEGPPVRRGFRFEGRVQRVGFRYQVSLIAQRLGLTGQAANLPDGSVRVELQGPAGEISRLVRAMQGLKRIRVERLTEEELPLKAGEEGFRIL